MKPADYFRALRGRTTWARSMAWTALRPTGKAHALRWDTGAWRSACGRGFIRAVAVEVVDVRESCPRCRKVVAP